MATTGADKADGMPLDSGTRHPTQGQGIHVAEKLSEKTIASLLDKLANDDDFRSAFQKNPREATRSLGTEDAAVDSLPDQPLPDLADKKSFSRSRDTLRRQLVESAYPFKPITLDIPEG